MAVNNLKKFNESAIKYGVTDYQLIMGTDKKGKNVIALVVKGYKFDKLSQYGLSGTDDIDGLMEAIACDVVKAYEHHVQNRNSVAKQKVNEGHGRSNDERFAYLLKQMMTYAKRFSGVQFIGQTMESVFDQLIERESLTLEQWVKGLIEWHGNGAKQKVLDAITNKDMHVIGDKVICDCTFRDFIKKYAKDNKLRVPNKDEQTKMIAVYLKDLERV